MNLFIQTLLNDPAFYLSWVTLIAFSICLHEYSHAATALRCGDNTAAERGHLTLNPLVQMGPMSIIILLVIGIAWGMVPVDEGRMRKKYHAALVSFAGPLANLLLCALFGIAAGLARRFLGDEPAGNPLLRFFFIGSSVNGLLFLFNLLPIPPLDGWHITANLFPRLKSYSSEQMTSMSWLLLLLVLITPALDMIWTGGELLALLFINLALAVTGGFA